MADNPSKDYKDLQTEVAKTTTVDKKTILRNHWLEWTWGWKWDVNIGLDTILDDQSKSKTN